MSSTNSPSRSPIALRPGKLDLLLTAIVSAVGLLLAYQNYHDGPTALPADGGPIHLSVIGIPAFLLFSLPLLYRTSAPRLGLLLLSASMVVYWAIFGPVVHCGSAYPAAALLAYGAGRRLRGTDRRIGAALAAGSVVAIGFTDALDPGTMVVGMPLTLMAFGIGVGVAAAVTRKRRNGLAAMADPAPVRGRVALRENAPA